LVNSKKIAGVLIENNFTTQAIPFSVIGVGLNVNQDEFGDFERTATSIKLILDKDFDRKKVMELFCQKLEKWYLKLKEQKFELIDETYLKYLYGIHQDLLFENLDKTVFEGEIIGVNKNGKLRIKLRNFQVNEFDVKEIKFLG
jgi:BirA family biotin operon repressor/biotin-[acetyl-CoA-carboxylase] ligase